MNDKPKEIKTIFAEALERQAGEERASYLEKACGGDAGLRAKVEELLESHEKAGSFLDVDDVNPRITLDQAPLSEKPGTIIGPYKLLEEIGEGGMAMVYMAEQTEPLRRRVALKIIKLGMDTKQVIARFEAERQALAIMDHPNIAKVLDAGATETGRPYFVMELVKGVSITEYCDKNRLNTKDRMELFVPVCHAVEHAHQKGIIHRDIKPTNVMVTLHDGKPVPKIIDFGIAKATCLELTEKTLFTRYAQMIGTPEYMSPEQAEFSGLDVDTRTDIYSLGVLLYELLTGAPPFDPQTMRSVAIGEIQRIIREDDPPRPSTRFSTMEDAGKKVAENRGTDIVTLAKNLNRELEWIPLKAMRKDRTRRYRSACELADDVENYLKDEPLIAGPESAMYRIGKFARRKRGLVAAIAAIAAVLIVSAAVSFVFAVRENAARGEAERQARISRTVSDFLRDDLLGSADPWTGRSEGSSVVSFLDAASRQLEGKFAEDPLIEASIRQTLGSTYWHLGRYEEAEKHLKRSLEIRRELLGNEVFETLLCMRELGWVYEHLGRSDEAEKLLIEALEGMRKILKEEDGTLLYCMGWLSWVYIHQGRYEEAERLQAEGLDIIRRKIGAEHAWAPSFIYSLGVIYKEQQRYEEAEKLLTEALDISRRTRGDQGIETLNIMWQLGELYSNQGRFEEAEELMTETLEGRREVYGLEHPSTFVSMDSLGCLYRAQGRLQEAQELLEEAYKKGKEALGPEHAETIDIMLHLAVVHQDQKRYEQAEELMKEALRISREQRGEDDNMTAWSLNTLGKLYEALRKYDKAQVHLNQELEIRRRALGNENPRTMDSIGNVALLYYKRGKIDEAEALGIEALEIMRRALGEDNPITLGFMQDFGWWYLSVGRRSKAEPLLTKALEGRRRILGEDHQDTQISTIAVHFLHGRYDIVEPLLLQALEQQRRIDGLEDPFTLFTIRHLAVLYSRQSRYDKAEPLLVEFVEESRKLFVEGHPDTIAALNDLIKLYEAWEKPQKAQEWREKLSEIQRK